MSVVPEMFATKSMGGSQRVSRVGGALLVVGIALGAGLSALVDHPAPVIAGALVSGCTSHSRSRWRISGRRPSCSDWAGTGACVGPARL
jgi:hypothetical protein